MKRLLTYMSFVRFEHTIFSLSFGLTSMMYAFSGQIIWGKIFLIIACVVFARCSAMSFNRIVDRHIDKNNPRTAVRELVTKKLNLFEAWIFFVVTTVLFIASAYLLNKTCFYLTPVALAIILPYSFLKRFTFLCHVGLGLSLSIAPLGAWIAIREEVSMLPILLSIATLLWVSAFDIIYALLDMDFDKRFGIYSIPGRFGKQVSLIAVKIFQLLMILVLLLFGYYANVSVYFYICVGIISLLLIFENLFIHGKDEKKVNQAFFQMNAIIGLLLFTESIIEFII